MTKITIFNTWVTSENMGDKIIMDACYEVIKEVFEDRIPFEVPTHDKMTLRSHKLIQESEAKILCGTCLLQPNMFHKKLWKVGITDSIFLSDAILLGVGWQGYSKKTGVLTKLLWRRLLSNTDIHSVRDEYTKQKLIEIGFKNVVNTACPTMWNLTNLHCKKIPTNKAENVVATITNYRKDLYADNKLLDILSENYKIVYLWPQSFEDTLYIKNLNFKSNVQMLPPTLDSYNELLNSNVDYVGTRLHAGIRALQKQKRTIIIGIDNRAIEKKTFGLMVIPREEINMLDEIINQPFETKINLPFEEIEKWKIQFQNRSNHKIKSHIIFSVSDKLKQSLKKIYISLKGNN